MAGVSERGGSRLRYWWNGPENGPVVALTHGATMDHRMFDPQVPVLTEAGYRTLAWDLRGHGESKPLGETPLTIADLAGDLLALLDEAGVSRPVCLIGQSLGGYVAQEAVLSRPERVGALVVIGSTCTTMPVARWEAWALKSSPWWFAAWPFGDLRRRMAARTAETPRARAYAYEAIGRLSRREFLEVWRAVAGAVRPRPGYTIEQPLLLTHGEHDTTGNIATTAPKWAARDPNCRYEVIPRAAHNANQDNPAEFNRILLEFLREHHPVAGRR
ncbi:alpha/beta fold hydrolase [Nonomuraea terrae]|uniref:alpha/beta fold hydrolase n=1 Tax=Nonomuraea terrae TaxID=2530383 RepID=UPI00379C6D63